MLFSLIMTQACSKKVITRRYYVLDSPSTADSLMNIKPLTNAICEILPVSVPPAYAQHRIAVRKRSHEINYYHNHQWAESPDQNIARLIQKSLESAQIFARVSDRIWTVAPRYQLNTFINHIEAIEGEDSLFAHISVELEIRDRTTNKVIVMHSFDRQLGYEDWDLNLLSQGMSIILQEEIGSFADKIRVHLVAQPEQTNSGL